MSSQNQVPDNANEGCPGVASENAGKAQDCEGCPNQSLCASGALAQKDPAIEQIAKALSGVKQVILVLSGKGGVGKSTVAAQTAIALAQDENSQVGILDVDICGPSQPHLLGLNGCEVHKSNEGWEPVIHHERQNLSMISVGFMLPSTRDAVIWRGPKKDGLIKQFFTDACWGELDYLVIDCPPGTSDEHISIATYLSEVPQTSAVIVTTPQEVSLLDVRKELDFCKKTGTRVLGVVENMAYFACPNCSCQTQIFPPTTGGATALCQEYALPLLAQIPISTGLGLSGEQGSMASQTTPEFASVAQFIKQQTQAS